MTDAKKQTKPTASETLKTDREQLVADLEKLLTDAKTLGADASSVSQSYLAEKAQSARAQLNDIIEDVKEQTEATKEQAVETLDNVETMIKKNPWRTVGIAVLAGIAIDRILRD
jgi:ElaB/YqjD/DUF883 family membrane-anchored ribosome-binding protein